MTLGNDLKNYWINLVTLGKPSFYTNLFSYIAQILKQHELVPTSYLPMIGY
jgi:hypothetical protein